MTAALLFVTLLLAAEPEANVSLAPPASEPILVSMESLQAERVRLIAERPSLGGPVSKLISSGACLTVGLVGFIFAGLLWPRTFPGGRDYDPTLMFFSLTMGGSFTIAGIAALTHGLVQFFRALPLRISNTVQVEAVDTQLTGLGVVPSR